MEELKDREEVLRLKEQALDSKRAKLQAKDSLFLTCSNFKLKFCNAFKSN